ncbi:hypothetical protein A3D11_01760 [Candidatus Peribacteria bacterium RIFCSPHIGHO2_02_FULL_49_16]|nr:MAG: hypothetical protein A2880_00870 [Candidatus Peribacteria bacterium RIFCSPHIGHO2_01_FULL_49_38]OGJ58643.1 MAG: hypothetical protein A3D11_01760 [Candidatus Peribacteria bacterium RIFCSPHIGHO2_02_FULL_49_16]
MPRTSVAQRAGVESALLSGALLSVLTFIAFLVSQARLQQEFGIGGDDVAFQIAMALLAAGGGCIVLAAIISRHLRRIYSGIEEQIYEKTRALEKQSEKDRTILESIHYGIFVVDKDGHVIDVNSQACIILGKTKETTLGMSIEQALPLLQHNSVLSKQQHPVITCLRVSAVQPSVSNGNMNMRVADGTVEPVMLTVSPIWSRGECTGAIAIFRDATEERRIDYLKSDFISLASHQLRTPLSTIGWYIELMMNEKERLSLHQVEYIHQIASSMERMVHIIDGLLRVMKLENETMTPKMQKVDVQTLLTQAFMELQTFAKDRKIACHKNLPQKPIFIRADPVLLGIILENFFKNAVEYTKENGEVTLSMKEHDHAVQISVQDTGIGIPRLDQERIFHKMFRSSNANTMKTDGSGLGLYVSKIIAESMKGEITFISKEGKGSTFTVCLPKRKKK